MSNLFRSRLFNYEEAICWNILNNDFGWESAAGRSIFVYKLTGKDWKVIHGHTSSAKPDATQRVFPSEREIDPRGPKK